MLFFEPSSEEVSLGEEFSFDLFLDTGGVFVNAAGVTVLYPAEKLEAVAIDASDSVFPIFAEREIEEGVLRIAAGIPTPGFAGTGKIATFIFRAKAEGQAELVFGKESVLLTNAENTNILDLEESTGAAVEIIPDSGAASSVGTASVEEKAPLVDLNSLGRSIQEAERILKRFLSFVF